MLDPYLSESLQEGNMYVEYSMERFEHRIPAQPRRSSNRFLEVEEQPTVLPRTEPQEGGIKRITSTGSSYSSSSSAPPSSHASLCGSDDIALDVPMATSLSGHSHKNDNLVSDGNAAVQEQVGNLGPSQFDNIVLATSALASTPANTGINFVQVTAGNAIDPSLVPASVRNLPETDARLFDPMRITLLSEEDLHQESITLPEIHSLRQHIAELAEDKRVLLEENQCLEKEKHALEASLTKTQREIEDAALYFAERISPSKGNMRVHAMDSDLQRLCNLSHLLGDENSRLRSQVRGKDSEVRIMKEEIGEMKTRNSHLVIEMASARAQREVLEDEIERIKETAVKAGQEAEEERARLLEEVDGAKRAMQGMREEEKRLISENLRLEREMGAVLENLEEFEAKQFALRGEKQRATIEASRRETELSDALTRAVSEGDACRKAVERAERAEASSLELHQVVADLRFQMQQMTREVESEKAGREAAVQEMALLRLRERALTQDMKQLVQTGDMAVQHRHHHLPALPLVSTSPRVATAAAALESQLSTWLSERADLQEVDKELHQQVEKLARGLSQSLQDMQDQLLHWKGITAHVELALCQACNRSARSAHHAKTLLFHIFPPSSSLSKRVIKTAFATGAIAGFGLLAYTKLRKSAPL